MLKGPDFGTLSRSGPMSKKSPGKHSFMDTSHGFNASYSREI